MPETQTKSKTEEKLDEELQKGQENFAEFLTVFGTLQEGIDSLNEVSKALLTVLTEDLIPALDELGEETKSSKEEMKVLRMVTAQMVEKNSSSKNIIGDVAQEIFGGSK